jgi:glycosyltransferase involved in cell wall biosynthesis
MKSLRIAHVVPPTERVPPGGYGGTERVVYELVTELVRRGHDVTTFASADSRVPGRHIETIDRALRPAGHGGDHSGYMIGTALAALARQDEVAIIHSHLEWYGPLLAKASRTPVVSTFHGRLDLPWSRSILAAAPDGLIAISESQASVHPDIPWTVVHNGLTLDDAPFERRRTGDLVFVGRIAPEKGPVEAIEIAREAGRHLRIIAKVGVTPPEIEYHETVFKPALEAAGSAVEFLGELSGEERDRVFAESYAVLMPGSWPEPFGLVAIEALACGTPILARNVGGLSEIVREGVDGFFGDDTMELAFLVDQIATLDREAIRSSVVDRFSARRMTDGYEAVYARRLGLAQDDGSEDDDGPGARLVAVGGTGSRRPA